MTYFGIALELLVGEIPHGLHDLLDFTLEPGANYGIEAAAQFNSVLLLVPGYSQIANVQFLEWNACRLWMFPCTLSREV